jgi:hypothetical protein
MTTRHRAEAEHSALDGRVVALLAGIVGIVGA